MKYEWLYSRLPAPWSYDLRRYADRRRYDAWRTHARQVDDAPPEYRYDPSVFDDTRSIFVHVPKCAGISVALALYGCLASGHATAERLRLVYGRDFWRYYRFTVVRNPYTRLVSAYSYIMDSPHDIWPKNRELQAELREVGDFDAFARERLPELARENVHFRPQTHFLLLGGRLPFSYIARTETLSDDFEEIKQHVNPQAQLDRKNVTPRPNPAASYYTSDATARKVSEVYAEDFERLGYDLSVPEA